jgi:NAD(P)-dependent dehydrogenase (short-subunit alcohol dehydrogenase family)
VRRREPRARELSVPLDGFTAIVTGGRVNIGYATVLRLLRQGARVIATTRFPRDAARRFAAEPDFASLAPRLELHGLDFRDLVAVEKLAEAIARDHRSIDAIVNNAAQTVRRPAGFHAALAAAELEGERPAIVSPNAYHDRLDAAELSRVPLLPGDEVAMLADERVRASWELVVGEISRVELLEVHHINALAPFLLVSRLLPLLLASRRAARFVVNVSSVEGRFDQVSKRDLHPHTNMAKAALNMMTRTIGPSLAERGVFVTSVDTGWVTSQHSEPLARAIEARYDFAPPLDAVDAAARVLDPIVRVELGEPPLHSVYLKDYRPASW